jgi:hypothetical protein
VAAEGYGSTPTPVSKLSGPEPGGGRTAVIHNEKRKTVYILCSIPLNLPIDELVTWKQLTGDRRLSDALAECDAKGWNALSLARPALAQRILAAYPSSEAAFTSRPISRQSSTKREHTWRMARPLSFRRSATVLWSVSVRLWP